MRDAMGSQNTYKTQSKTVEQKKLVFDCVRNPVLGFSRKRPLSTDKFDCERNGLSRESR